ncbi:MAG: hypothetical protein AABY64_07460 [Bdellovibrionota bacterium]
MKAALTVMILSILSLDFAFASGPDYITEVQIYNDQSCQDQSKDCFMLCYQASTAYGINGKCSAPTKMTIEIKNKISVVKKIFDKNKEKNNGKLSFALEELHRRGDFIARGFSVLDFLSIIEKENELAGKKD